MVDLVLENDGREPFDRIGGHAQGLLVQVPDDDPLRTQDTARDTGDGKAPFGTRKPGLGIPDDFGVDIEAERLTGFVETLHGDQPA